MRKIFTRITLLLLAILSFSLCHAQYILHIAGNDSSGFKDGPAFHASFNQPGPICRDKNGNLFIVDDFSRIRELGAATNIVTTIAGSSLNPADTTDNLPATDAFFALIGGICVNAAGDLLIANSKRIQKINRTTGMLTTIFGTHVAVSTGDGGPATAAQFSGLLSVAVDHAGNIYVSEFPHNDIRKISAATGIVTTIAGGNAVGGFGGDGGPATAAKLDRPNSISVDAAGNVYFADFSNKRVRRIDAATGTITTVAGNGSSVYSGNGVPATAASIENNLYSTALDNAGNLYLSDETRIRKVDKTTGIITTIAGDGTLTATIDSVGDGGPATAAEVHAATLCFDTCNNLFIADIYSRIRVITNTLPVNGKLCGLVVSGVASPSLPEGEELLRTWPNPSYGSFTLHLSSPANEQVHVQVTDLTGRLIKELHCITNKDTEVRIERPGLYFVTAETENGRYVKKMVVER